MSYFSNRLTEKSGRKRTGLTENWKFSPSAPKNLLTIKVLRFGRERQNMVLVITEPSPYLTSRATVTLGQHPALEKEGTRRNESRNLTITEPSSLTLRATEIPSQHMASERGKARKSKIIVLAKTEPSHYLTFRATVTPDQHPVLEKAETRKH